MRVTDGKIRDLIAIQPLTYTHIIDILRYLKVFIYTV